MSDPDPGGQLWAVAMADTLVPANRIAHEARAAGRVTLVAAELATIRNRCAGAIALGRDQNRTGRDPLHAAARSLLRRFERHQDMILRSTTGPWLPTGLAPDAASTTA